MTELAFEQPPNLSNVFMQRLIGQFEADELDLPPLSATAMQLQELVTTPDVDIDDVTRVVLTDQGLSSHLLKVANSVSYAPEVPIESVGLAITRLGLKAMSEMVVAVLARDQLFGPLLREERVRQMWQRAAVAGVYARRLGMLRASDPNSSILTGLLADVGKPVAYKLLSDLTQALRERLDPATLDYLIEELHVPIGQRLAESWKLPAPIATAIAYHHEYDAAPDHRDAAMIACAATQIAAWSLDPDGCSEEEIRRLPVIEDLAFDQSQLAVLFANPEEARLAASAFA